MINGHTLDHSINNLFLINVVHFLLFVSLLACIFILYNYNSSLVLYLRKNDAITAGTDNRIIRRTRLFCTSTLPLETSHYIFSEIFGLSNINKPKLWCQPNAWCLLKISPKYKLKLKTFLIRSRCPYICYVQQIRSPPKIGCHFTLNRFYVDYKTFEQTKG